MRLIANLRGGHMAALASRCESLVPQRKSVRPSQDIFGVYTGYKPSDGSDAATH